VQAPEPHDRARRNPSEIDGQATLPAAPGRYSNPSHTSYGPRQRAESADRDNTLELAKTEISPRRVGDPLTPPTFGLDKAA
jgi:hypothetical protein